MIHRPAVVSLRGSLVVVGLSPSDAEKAAVDGMAAHLFSALGGTS